MQFLPWMSASGSTVFGERSRQPRASLMRPLSELRSVSSLRARIGYIRQARRRQGACLWVRQRSDGVCVCICVRVWVNVGIARMPR